MAIAEIRPVTAAVIGEAGASDLLKTEGNEGSKESGQTSFVNFAFFC
jgi:hypothetical protein